MPRAPKKCHVCGRWYDRNRSLSFHIRQAHSDAWMDEPLCSVEPATTDAAPPAVTNRDVTTNQSPPSAVTNRSHSASPVVVTSGRAAAASRRQATGSFGHKRAGTGNFAAAQSAKRRVLTKDPPSHLRRVTRNADRIRTIEVASQVDARYTTPSRRHQHAKGTRLRTVPHYRHQSADEHLTEFAEQSTPDQRRDLCDCSSCVNHALWIAETDFPHRAPERMPLPNFRYVRLPGLDAPSSTTDQRDELSRRLQGSPVKASYACGCQHCVVHRCHLRTHNLVIALPPIQAEVD